MFLIRAKTVEAESSLEEISSLLSRKILESEDDQSDLETLKTYVDDSRRALQESNKAFLGSIELTSEKEVLKAYLNQNDALNRITGDLEKQIADFKPEPQENVGRWTRMINHFINYFKKDYAVLGNDPKYVLEKRLSQLKGKSSHEPRVSTYMHGLKRKGIETSEQEEGAVSSQNLTANASKSRKLSSS